MTRPRIHADAKAREAHKYALRKARRQAGAERKVTVFCGVDGEGENRVTGERKIPGTWPGTLTITTHEHFYVMLGVGSQHIHNPEGLDFRQIAAFLYSCYQAKPGLTYTGFFLGYDFTQWLKTLPENRAYFLLTSEGKRARARKASGDNRTPFPVRYAGWEFDILGVKRFKLRPCVCECGKARCGHKQKPWMYICDAGSFFQASLLTVISPSKWKVPVVSPEEYRLLSDGKSKRDSARYGPDMVLYNSLENEVLARLMERLSQGFSEIGVKLKTDQWFGPGQAAQAWLKQTPAPLSKALKERKDLREPGEAARRAYFGGWFEIFAHGIVPGTSHEYDINSAYPYVAAKLPCLLHGTWTYSASPDMRAADQDTPGILCLVRARITGRDKRIGAMLHRHPDGRIVRPSATGGWYWASELRAAIRAGLVSEMDIAESWTYVPCDCKPPLAGLRDLYDYRLSVGKDSSQGKGARLVFNSAYGKFAQSEGSPVYGNPFYASLITSGCREIALDAIATHPGGTSAVLMVATDAVFFTSPHPGLDVTSRLGDWDHAERENLTLFKPGVYWDDKTRESIQKGEAPVFKARGISARVFAAHIAEADRQFRGWNGTYPPEKDPATPGGFPRITFPSGFTMVTALQALRRGKWELAGAVGEREVVQDSDPIAKRHSGEYDPESGIYWSRPHRGWSDEPESTPYRKEFGVLGDDDEIVTEDGDFKSLVSEVLSGDEGLTEGLGEA